MPLPAPPYYWPTGHTVVHGVRNDIYALYTWNEKKKDYEILPGNSGLDRATAHRKFQERLNKEADEASRKGL